MTQIESYRHNLSAEIISNVSIFFPFMPALINQKIVQLKEVTKFRHGLKVESLGLKNRMKMIFHLSRLQIINIALIQNLIQKVLNDMSIETIL